MLEPQLEATILSDPTDPASYLVLADWLQTRGDPHGELIVLHHRRSQEAAAHLERHAAVLLGRFATSRPRVFKLEWRLGFIRSATIGWQRNGGNPEEDPSSAQLAAFLTLPAARFLERLELGPTAHEEQLDELAASIEEAAPPNLRELFLGDTRDWDISRTSTRMPCSSSIPRMRKLRLRGGQVTLDEQIELPELVWFIVESGSLDTASLHAISAARWPNLELLEIWFGDPLHGASGGVADIGPILDGQGLGKLRHLGLRNCPFADELVEVLARSRILLQIGSLDLSMGNLSDDGVETMLASWQRFSHLQMLDLSENALSPMGRRQASRLTKTIRFASQYPERAVPRDETNRHHPFVSVGE